MNIQDIVALAKAGFKASEIMELTKQPEPEVHEEPVKQEVIEEPAKEPEQQEVVPDERDARIAELEKQLANAQKANIKQGIDEPNKNTDVELFEELARSFM